MSELDNLVSDALMTGYGYHREWNYLYDRPKWVKGFERHVPSHMNEPSPQDPGCGDEEPSL